MYRYTVNILSISTFLGTTLFSVVGEAKAGTLTNWNDSNALIDNVNSRTIPHSR